jgi:hypothetical protein
VFVAMQAWSRGAPFFLLENRNHNAHTITDHDIAIANCGFDAMAQNHAGFHAINIRMARHVRVSDVRCSGGGDCTAMMATDDTLVENSAARGMLNACWDHWEAPSNGIVRGGFCSTARRGSGLFITGGGGGSSGEMAQNFVVQGGTYLIGGDGVGVWVMGLGRQGEHNGAANVTITGVRIDLGDHGHPCFKVSGATTKVSVSDFICSNGVQNAIYIGAGGDNGNAPSDVRFTKGTIERPTSAGRPPVQIESRSSSIDGINVVRHAARSWQLQPELERWSSQVPVSK